jgi:hypothetical protein
MRSCDNTMLFRLFLLILAAPAVRSTTGTTSEGESLIHWLRSKDGGFFHSALAIVNSTLVARADLKQGDLLIDIPVYLSSPGREPKIGDRTESVFDDELVVGTLSDIYNETGLYFILFDDGTVDAEAAREDFFVLDTPPANCDTVELLEKTIQIDSNSFAPWLSHLTRTNVSLPMTWSSEGLEYFLEILGMKPSGAQALPPFKIEKTQCNMSSDSLEVQERLYSMVAQQQLRFGDRFVPIVDLIKHANGHQQNTDIFSGGNTIKIQASRDIKAGEAIATSYTDCNECEHGFYYGTPELVRDYGFVEDFPQQWYFPEQQIAFELNDENSLEWIKHKHTHSEEGYHFLQAQLQRLEDLCEIPLPDIPKHEIDLISEYHDALMMAMHRAIKAMGKRKRKKGWNWNSDKIDRYEPLIKLKEEWADTRPATCDTYNIFQVKHWELEPVRSPYQTLNFASVRGLNDTCFAIEGTSQIMVHYPARFIDTIKRVLFVGGGDSMLLHETLKYPSLELVVGLELDQAVTRASFKHFGTQPHWDNEKVEWWFGDATKSLLMLPKEYFGSFDLVLVDLSETVMAMSVLEDLDVKQALSVRSESSLISFRFPTHI